MANGCEAFGRIIPDTYIDKVFLEEALIDTNNDGTVEQLPKPQPKLSKKHLQNCPE